jgi:hypothetical protein
MLTVVIVLFAIAFIAAVITVNFRVVFGTLVLFVFLAWLIYSGVHKT